MIFVNLPRKREEEAKKLVRNIKTVDIGSGGGKFISRIINPKKVVAIDIDEKG